MCSERFLHPYPQSCFLGLFFQLQSSTGSIPVTAFQADGPSFAMAFSKNVSWLNTPPFNQYRTGSRKLAKAQDDIKEVL
jgi:hypothetical protein